jgi:hypothetical protein
MCLVTFYFHKTTRELPRTFYISCSLWIPDLNPGQARCVHTVSIVWCENLFLTCFLECKVLKLPCDNVSLAQPFYMAAIVTEVMNLELQSRLDFEAVLARCVRKQSTVFTTL